MKTIDYRDADGIQRRVALPDESTIDPSEGLPVSLNLDMLFEGLPHHFRVAFYQALWDVGLIEPCDYTRPGASDLFRRAMMIAIKQDFFAVLQLAREACDSSS